jgi:hypothetical protein
MGADLCAGLGWFTIFWRGRDFQSFGGNVEAAEFFFYFNLFIHIPEINFKIWFFSVSSSTTYERVTLYTLA